MVSILASLPFALAYLDDTAVLASSPRDMEDKLEQVFHRFRVANLRLHPAKCTFSATRLKFLGFIFESGTLRINQDRVALLRDYPPAEKCAAVKILARSCNFLQKILSETLVYLRTHCVSC
jgi:hypothetical protein